MLSKLIRLTWTFPEQVNALLIKTQYPFVFCLDLLNNKEYRTASPLCPWTSQRAAGAWRADTSTYLHVWTHLFSKPSWIGAITCCTITDCCWDKACSGNRSWKLRYWMTKVLKSCCYEAGNVIVNLFSWMFLFVSRWPPLGLNDSIAMCVVKKSKTTNSFTFSN